MSFFIASISITSEKVPNATAFVPPDGTLDHVTEQELVCADLKKFLKKNADGNTLGVADSKLGSIIREKLGIPCIYRSARTLHVQHWAKLLLSLRFKVYHTNA